MRLYCTPGSPYARMVRVAAIELGVGGLVEIEFVPLRDPASPLLTVNPTGKAPTLVTEEGVALSEARICVEHLERLAAPRRLSAPADDLAGRSREGVAAGFLDGIANWGREHRRPAELRWPWMEEVERARAERCLACFETDPVLLGGSVDLAAVTIACALAWGLRNVPGFDPTASHPRLLAWHRTFTGRESMRVTEPGAG